MNKKEVIQEFNKASKFYNNDNSYHNAQHVMNMLNDYYNFQNDIDRYYPSLNKEILIKSIIWHNVSYVHGNKENQENACRIYMNNNKYYDIFVMEAIFSTALFENKFDNDEQRILHDLDLLYFCKYDDLIKTEKLIEQEYNCNHNDFLLNIKNFYLECLNKYSNNMYKSKIFSTFNLSVKININRRLKEIIKKIN